MSLQDFIQRHLLDVIAFSWFVLWWAAYYYYSRWALRRETCLARVMHNYRYDWMSRLLEREIRIADTTIMTHLERNGAFFASSTLLILAALFTMLGATDQAIGVLSELPFSTSDSRLEWELKILLLITIFVYAFFTFSWSMRQYNFCAILIGAAPMPDDESVTAKARKAYAEHTADLIDLAANQFNYGLRAYYYGLAVLCWFWHPVIFMTATVLISCVLYRREFYSKTLRALRAARDDRVEFLGIIR
ncbi:DUF599 domain-containing protein [Oceanospirillum sediminis]|uniref:DUF599 family protein n=1 Tax=Oceanospirillum sediminis TaxID=2760088 RepID=A0A839IXN6_9GAMM|nr:DUF599 family protein [Oceanospirillum sediminis]MBB1489209.1 DUF599 family protein [Oceanospirillum sediminis]